MENNKKTDAFKKFLNPSTNDIDVKNNGNKEVSFLKPKGLIEVKQLDKLIITEDGRQLLK